MIAGAEPVRRFLVISSQDEPSNLTAMYLYCVETKHRAGKAVPILLEKMHERKKVSVSVRGKFAGVKACRSPNLTES